MCEAAEEVLKFVNLVERHADVLLKSQTTSNKEKKKAAASSIIQQWAEISNINLTEASLLKKINNLKTRAKSALKIGKPMAQWQVKLLDFVKSDDKGIVEEGQSSSSSEASGNDDTPLVPANLEMSAEQVLNQFETAETKSMSIEQLQRFVLLQKLHVLTLQRRRLEYLNNVDNGKSVTIDYIGFDETLIDGNQVTDHSV